MSSEDLTRINPSGSSGPSMWQQLRLVLVASGLAVAGATGLQMTTPDIRADAFTSKQAQRQREEILTEVNRRAVVDHIVLRRDIEANIPPDEVTEALSFLRQRISHLEDNMRSIDPGFRPELRR